ncbi:MAG TPA: hypothetical protein VK529_06135, partial [Gemmatimonadaceae bacterium]|nr:hypothetical protein [Gemmatimonadaceae bacterium]
RPRRAHRYPRLELRLGPRREPTRTQLSSVREPPTTTIQLAQSRDARMGCTRTLGIVVAPAAITAA